MSGKKSAPPNNIHILGSMIHIKQLFHLSIKDPELLEHQTVDGRCEGVSEVLLLGLGTRVVGENQFHGGACGCG